MALSNAITDYLSTLPQRRRDDPMYSEFCRTTSVLHSVVIKTFLSQGLSVDGVTPEAVERVCARFLRKVDGMWFFRGEAIGANGADGRLFERIEIIDEISAIAWLRQRLATRPMAQGELNTDWKVATLRVSLEKTLEELLAENFWRDEDTNRWREPTDAERERMNDDHSVRVLHDAERYLANTLRRRTTDGERCDWIDVLFSACRQVEEGDTQSTPTLRDFDLGEGYRLITRLFQSILGDHVPPDVFAKEL